MLGDFTKNYGDVLGVKWDIPNSGETRWDPPSRTHQPEQARCNTLGQDLSAAARLLRRAPGLTVRTVSADMAGVEEKWEGLPFFLAGQCVPGIAVGPDIKGTTILWTKLPPAQDFVMFKGC